MASDIPLVLFLIFITLFFISRKNRTKNQTIGLPPGPTKIPIIGNLHQLGKVPHRSLHTLSKKFGDIMFLQLGSVRAVIVSSPDMARELFKNHDLIISGRPTLYAFSKISLRLPLIVTAPYGESWRELRKIMILELTTAKRVQSFAHVRAQEVATTVDEIASRFPDPVDLSSLAFSLVNNVVRRAAFSEANPRVDEHGRGFQEIFHDVQQLAAEFNIADYFPWLGWINRFNGVDKRLEMTIRDLDTFLDKLIEQHVEQGREKEDHEDLVGVLLKIQKDPNHAAITDEQIKGVLADVFIAGTDTAAATIEWTMAELMRNPAAREKAHQEVRKVGQGKARIEEDDLPKLTYLKQIIKESFRLHPPVPILVPRETMDKCIIGNKYEIPEKTRVFLNASAIGQDPKYFENPEEFLPERFLNSQVDYRGQHFELLPFGAGRRGCPAINFAIPIVELVLANLLFRFDWELPKGMSAEDVDMEEAVGVTMHKKTPLHLVALPVH